MFYFLYKSIRRTGFLLMIVIGSLISCESEKPPATFYPVDSLITSQIEHLTSIRAGLFKEALLEEEADTITYIPDDVAWQKELEVFAKLNDINRPVNKTNYQVSDGLLDSQSNLTVKEFQSLKDLPIEYLKIYYYGTVSRPRKIEAKLDEKNLLYGSARILSMHFQQVNGATVLTAYSVKGGQKMIFGDSVAFFINGKVLID